MPRVPRHFSANYVWHITQRCHKKEFLLKFARDRERWIYWLFEARKRYGLCVLNYIVTSNHIHLLVLDQGNNEIPESMKLVAGRTAQEYNQRKARRGAYWEGRYTITAIDSEVYLSRCMQYIDLNMVRAGRVRHPKDWRWSGYYEIQSSRQRYNIIDKNRLVELFNTKTYSQFQKTHAKWFENQNVLHTSQRDEKWTQSLAVGHKSFVEEVKESLNEDGRYKLLLEDEDGYSLNEVLIPYGCNFEGKISRLSE